MPRKPKDPLVSATYMIPKSVKEEVQKQAGEEGLSAGDIVRRIFRGWFGKDKAKSPDMDSGSQV